MAVPAARADEGDPFFDACVNAGAAQGACQSANGSAQAFPEALSPDGRQLYVAAAGGGGDPAVLVYDRDPGSGKLTRRLAGPTSCVTASGSSGACGQASQLANPQDLVVSPDGKNVYVSNADTGALVELSRTGDGGLTVMAECHNSSSGSAACTHDTGFVGAAGAMALSPDGKSLYLSVDGGQGIG